MSSFISTVLFANVNLSVGALEHSPEVLLKSAPGDTVSREHVMSTVLSAGWSSARTPLKLPLGARRKPARGIIRRGDTSRANVTGGPVEKRKAGVAHFENKAEINNLQKGSSPCLPLSRCRGPWDQGNEVVKAITCEQALHRL